MVKQFSIFRSFSFFYLISFTWIYSKSLCSIVQCLIKYLREEKQILINLHGIQSHLHNLILFIYFLLLSSFLLFLLIFFSHYFVTVIAEHTQRKSLNQNTSLEKHFTLAVLLFNFCAGGNLQRSRSSYMLFMVNSRRIKLWEKNKLFCDGIF